MSTEDGRLVSVEINGIRYPIRSQLDAAYVADLAAYVEQKMLLAARESPAGDTLKIGENPVTMLVSQLAQRRREIALVVHVLLTFWPRETLF